ncbi:SH3 domain-containing protein 19 isoform X2 [Ostrinia nubilalis]
MKGPTRPAPGVPKPAVNRYSPVTNWNDDPFGADLFEPAPYVQKKMPPPRPPPPKVGNKQPDVPVKPSHFVRRPTVLSSLLSRKKNSSNNHANQHNVTDLPNEVDTSKVFPKCEPKNIQTGTLIDFSSPPSSPTFTTRSSSDGLSVDSFGSDATTSTNHHNANNGGNASQAESGFEDDFDLFLNSRKKVTKDDTFDDLATIDPFSPQPVVNKPPIMKKPIINKDLFEMQTSNQPITIIKGPTIIRAKPARPKPPDNSALLKTTFGSTFPVTPMTINTTTPIQKICNGFGDTFESRLAWDSSPEPSSPPMPSVPPPPPPPEADEDLPVEWPEEVDFNSEPNFDCAETEKPYAIALFDYFTDHPDDLCFSANSRINLIRRVDHEWLYGSLRSGAEGLFPCSYVEIKVPLPNEAKPAHFATATALYDFEPAQPGDLRFRIGDTITVLQKVSDEWYFGECNGMKGQFPVNYVQLS